MKWNGSSAGICFLEISLTRKFHGKRDKATSNYLKLLGKRSWHKHRMCMMATLEKKGCPKFVGKSEQEVLKYIDRYHQYLPKNWCKK